MMSPLILREDRDGLAWLTLNQPEKRNALSLKLLQELRLELRRLKADKTARVVLLRAAGPVFSSGHDLKELRGAPKAQLQEIFHTCTEVMELLPALPQPVIAVVHALATAAGCQLALSCDLVLAADTASFATPGVKIGLFCTTPGIPLARSLPTKKAMEMLLTGTPISAADAERFGMINRVVPTADLEKEAEKLALQIATASPTVLAGGKQAFYRLLGQDRASAYAMAEPLMVQAAGDLACKEGITAFLEKRKPVWP